MELTFLTLGNLLCFATWIFFLISSLDIINYKRWRSCSIIIISILVGAIKVIMNNNYLFRLWMSGDDVGTVFTFSADICKDVTSRSQWILRVELTNSIWKLSLIELITLYILYALGYYGSGMCLSQSVLFYWRPLLSLVPVLFVFANTNFTAWPTWRFLLQFMLPSVNQAFCFVCSSFS